jgi:8-oxo-dGTP pyrophosphatase MutT (NUDIX family)
MIGDEEQYASAFALMARSLGYPARVVMGFAPEVPDGGGTVTVTGDDVTAWVEVAFDGVGWVPFAPTPDETDIPQDQVPKPQSEPQPQWELPAGLLDVPGEDPLLAAQRELAEEADVVAAEWRELITFATSPGGSDEMIQIFEARELSAAAEVYARTEEEAELVLRWVPLAEVVEAALAGRLRNSILLVAVLAAYAHG